MTLRTLSFPLKVLVTLFLLTMGLGYLSALAYLYLIDVEPHTKHGMGLVAAVIMKYYGQRETTSLEAALRGPMGSMSPSRREHRSYDGYERARKKQSSQRCNPSSRRPARDVTA